MFFKQVYDETLAQASYIVGCQAKGIAAVIDPKRDVDTYLMIAEQEKLQITHVFETHIHADFLSGSRELAELTGAKLYLSDEGGPDWQYEFAHEGLKHGDVVKLGNISIEALHTPGHTPEHMSFLLTDHPASDSPVMLFTGDFVFVGDVGRPDLLEEAAGLVGTKEKGAHHMFDSLQEFVQLNDMLLLWPGHGAGSACGKALGAVNMSTVGYEKIRNWAIQLLDNREKFVEELLSDQPEPPKYFAMMKKLNKVDRALLPVVPKVPNLHQKDWDEMKKSHVIIDTRHDGIFAEGFVEGSYNIKPGKNFSTWMGWVMDYETDFILIAEDAQIEDFTRKLMRIGLDNFKGYITPEQLATFEKDLKTYHHISKEELKEELDHLHVLDVRNNQEFKDGHIESAQHIFVGKLEDKIHEIPRDRPIAVHCQSGYRSAIAMSILQKHGIENVRNYAGGWAEWSRNLAEIKA
ncbi:MAG: MBL fold metallo-hydrolase [Flavobacteriaceae bacterium]|nr:MBL fold metallo-hydrolase [Flavobacteriaceae bacterium]